jgi:hypothetical protein
MLSNNIERREQGAHQIFSAEDDCAQTFLYDNRAHRTGAGNHQIVDGIRSILAIRVVVRDDPIWWLIENQRQIMLPLKCIKQLHRENYLFFNPRILIRLKADPDSGFTRWGFAEPPHRAASNVGPALQNIF